MFSRTWSRERRTSCCIEPCGDGSIDVKSTELNIEKGLKTRRFKELGVRFLSALLDNKCPFPCDENKG